MSKVIAKALFAVLISMAAIAESFSYYTGISHLFCLATLLPISSIGTIYLARKYCYRPPENHLGAVYRLGRFNRFVGPDEWTFLIPYIDRVHREVSLYMRTAEISLKRVELQDGLTVDVRFKVFYRTDLRLTSQENLLQVLKFEGSEWPEMIKTSMEDIIRNQIFLDIDHAKLNLFRKSRKIKNMISKEISNRTRGFGILVNEEYGAMLVEAHPNEAYFEAVQKYKAATPIGQAALERLQPMLDALKKMRHEDARTALLLEIASKITEVENLPDLVLSPTEDYISSNSVSTENRRGVEAYKQQKRNPQKDLPLAN